jgi:hypothetical protein
MVSSLQATFELSMMSSPYLDVLKWTSHLFSDSPLARHRWRAC